MAINQTHSFDQGIREDDYVRKRRLEAHFTQDAKTEYKPGEVEVEWGPRNEQTKKRERTKVRLKFQVDQPFIFAVFAENPEMHRHDRDEWDHVAKEAIERFLAMRGVQIKIGPMRELGNSFNWAAETSKPIERSPESIEADRVAEAKKQARLIQKAVAAGDPSALASIIQGTSR